MKKKIIFTLAFCSILALSTRGLSAGATGGSASSDATVTFTGNNGPTDPVDPIDPTNPGDGGGTGMNGPLSLDYVPNLDFGSNAITGNIETYESGNLKPYIQVSDTRGANSGWDVKVTFSEFVDNSNPLNKFSGAKLTLNNSVIKTSSTGNPKAPTAPSTVTLTSGSVSETTVFSAAGDSGKGTWINTWLAANTVAGTNENATLEVDTTSVQLGSYTAKLNWVLSVTP